jgi:hypothetical protein
VWGRTAVGHPRLAQEVCRAAPRRQTRSGSAPAGRSMGRRAMDERGKIDRPRNYLPMTCGWRDHACTPRDGQVQAFQREGEGTDEGKNDHEPQARCLGLFDSKKSPGRHGPGHACVGLPCSKGASQLGGCILAGGALQGVGRLTRGRHLPTACGVRATRGRPTSLLTYMKIGSCVVTVRDVVSWSHD